MSGQEHTPGPTESLRDWPTELLQACEEYVRELDNPSPDLRYRAMCRDRIREIMAYGRAANEGGTRHE